MTLVWTFTPAGKVASGPGRIAVTPGHLAWIEVFSSQDRPAHRIQVEATPRNVTPELLLRSVHESGLPEGVSERDLEEMVRRTFERGAISPTLPEIDDLFLDRDGRLWVEWYREPGNPHHSWMVFDPQGWPIARMHVPASLDLRGFSDGLAIGIWKDELNVETIRAFGVNDRGCDVFC